MHYPSEMPYRCESCGYHTSSHKDVIDHYYKAHEKGEGLQCPYCLKVRMEDCHILRMFFLPTCQCGLNKCYYCEKVIQFANEDNPSASNVHAYLSHMQRHVVRRDQGKGNKCSRCCLWFNQKSSLTIHQRELHDCVSNSSKYVFINVRYII